MKGEQIIRKRQLEWARKEELSLENNNDYKNLRFYVKELEENLFKALSNETRNEYEEASGNELTDSNGVKAKMKALYSSSALVVNTFQYWRNKKEVNTIAKALFGGRPPQQFVDLEFERQFEVTHPARGLANIDVVLSNRNGCICAVESKFCEVYSTPSIELSNTYNDPKLWEGLKNIHKHAYAIRDRECRYEHLDALQLIKHTIGILKQYNKENFTLVYLWYNTPTDAASTHEKEIAKFCNIIQKDGINFHHTTYQEVLKYIDAHNEEAHNEYIEYHKSRYML